MNLVVDASVLVGVMLRKRELQFFQRPDIQLLVPERQWSETIHEVHRRLKVIESKRAMPLAQIQSMLESLESLIDQGFWELIPTAVFSGLEEMARGRIPRDPNDWQPVALAILLDASILTNDCDFIGCGCPTRTLETLRREFAGTTTIG